DVQFHGLSARVIRATVHTITTVVPIGATTGPIAVSVFGQTATGPAFTVSSLPPNANFAQRTFNFFDASSDSGGMALTFNNNDDAIARGNLPSNFLLFRDI